MTTILDHINTITEIRVLDNTSEKYILFFQMIGFLNELSRLCCFYKKNVSEAFFKICQYKDYYFVFHLSKVPLKSLVMSFDFSKTVNLKMF